MISDEERPPMKIDIVNQRLEELINNLIIEEEEKEKESIINANQTIQNDIFFFSLLINHLILNDPKEEKQQIVSEAIKKFNEVSSNPIRSKELTQIQTTIYYKYLT